MPLKVIRRPYQDCAYRWALSTLGISTGEGDCSNEQCLALNGDFNLDFSACDSKGGKLVWAGGCEGNNESDPSPCMICDQILNNDLPWTPPDVDYTESGATIVWGTGWTGILGWSSLFYDRTFACEWSDRKFGVITTSDPDSVAFPPPDMGGGYGGRKYWVESSPGVFTCDLLLYATFRSASRRIDIIAAIPDWDDPSVLVFSRQLFLATAYIGDPGSCESPETFSVDSSATLNTTAFDFSGEVVVTYSGEGGSTGPDKNDRIRSKWHLEYDIEAQLWTLRSFNRIDYPIYTLSDASPCDGDTKTLPLADKGDSSDGCGIAPAEVTITRVCPPDRVGNSALLEDRKPNGATGKRKRQCGCDCLDEVDDRRQCATKCTSTEDEGCGNIDPAPDDITCRYPEAINCCANTAGKDVPCAYTVEFECDLFFDIEDVRHKIAAKQVVLRRECYFEDPCLFVAPGPESSTGGSPVMDVDGFPGAKPVCASCSDPCLTGCTWSAWSVAACPAESALCEAAADKTKCLEFRWLDVLGTGYTTGAVASVLRFVSETVASSGLIIWEYASDDGRWLATIYPNAQVNVNVVCGSGATCGEGVLTWLDSPEVSPCGGWRSQNYTQPSGASGPCQDWDIVDDGITFSNICFGCSCTTLQLYWIACP